MELSYIPSPSRGVIYLGEIPLRGYAFCIILGVFAAIWLGNRRWAARGGQSGTVADVAVWAVLFGLVGGRLYHVLTTPEPYFGDDGKPMDAFKIWEGGLGIWGAIALGALGAWIGCRRRGIPFPAYADAVAPGIVLAQALGRWGNWFNQELYGKATDLPWAVEISEDKRPADSLDVATYHPTFLYESLWCLLVMVLVLWADRRFRLGHGRVFALYVAGYTAGRFWTEYLRIDEAHEFAGLRLNDWTSIVVFVGAVAGFVISAKRHPGREDAVEPALVPAAAEERAGDADAPSESTGGAGAVEAHGGSADGGDAKAESPDSGHPDAGSPVTDHPVTGDEGAEPPAAAEPAPADGPTAPEDEPRSPSANGAGAGSSGKTA